MKPNCPMMQESKPYWTFKRFKHQIWSVSCQYFLIIWDLITNFEMFPYPNPEEKCQLKRILEQNDLNQK